MSITLRLRQVVDDPLFPVARRNLLQAFEGERRLGTIVQQPFQPGPVATGNVCRFVDRETAVVPGEHHRAPTGHYGQSSGAPKRWTKLTAPSRFPVEVAGQAWRRFASTTRRKLCKMALIAFGC